MVDFIYLNLYRFFRFLLQILPISFTILLMKFLAYLAYYISYKHRNIIYQNLNLAFKDKLTQKEKKDIAIDAFANLIDTTFGIMRRDGMDKNEVIQNVDFEGLEIINEYKNNNKLFILVTGHYGNWELLSQALAIKCNLTLVGIGRKLDSDVMESVLKQNRERFSVEMIYKDGAIKGALRAISQKKIVGILVDQHISKHLSVDVDFFNHKATHTPIASLLSRKVGIDLIPAFISTQNYKRYKIKIYPPIKSIKSTNQEEDLKILTQQQSNIIQQVIIANPNQWFWMHKRWKGFYKDLYL